ncbi:hypothetical protein BX285_7037 [Streptomyces sp. 1114.5]|uniref:hypothetical protein n=1 Tax=unclassified Streptomyces TaxID=2593676 RepID=UPI000BC7DB3D|nr:MULTISPECIES: hypothetical protein [unclassified Streptomyces]RKT08674.1 hypothetical protein BX285_7037 [Streptomyces sp. 1114.5]SOB78829.1 hypothetical protein SAMN06272789_0112 [Streptomyces sp. 1331.2]
MPLVTTRLAGTVLAAALLVPAAAACSSSSSSDAHGTAAATTPAAPTADTATATSAAPSAPATTVPVSPKPSSSKATAAAAATGKGTSPARGQTLVDGSTAEVQASGNQNYSARIVNKGSVLATLETHDGDAGLDGNGMFVVLSMDGTVHSWMGGEQQGPGTFTLAGGWRAKVTKVGELHYRAQVLGSDNAVMGALEADRHDAGAVANGIYIVLSAGGVISSHA